MRNLFALIVLLNISYGIWAVALPQEDDTSADEPTTLSTNLPCATQVLIYEERIASLEAELAVYIAYKEAMMSIMKAVFDLTVKSLGIDS